MCLTIPIPAATWPSLSRKATWDVTHVARGCQVDPYPGLDLLVFTVARGFAQIAVYRMLMRERSLTPVLAVEDTGRVRKRLRGPAAVSFRQVDPLAGKHAANENVELSRCGRPQCADMLNRHLMSPRCKSWRLKSGRRCSVMPKSALPRRVPF